MFGQFLKHVYTHSYGLSLSAINRFDILKLQTDIEEYVKVPFRLPDTYSSQKDWLEGKLRNHFLDTPREEATIPAYAALQEKGACAPKAVPSWVRTAPTRFSCFEEAQ